MTRILTFQNIVFREKDSIAIGTDWYWQYTYTTLLLDITHRRQDLESDLVECIWLELKPSTNASNIFLKYICLFLYRNPSASYEWFDNFVQMIDTIHTVKPHADILVLGYFNIDLLTPHSSWESAITLLGLTQLVKSPTRITQTSATLIDHMYTNNPDVITEVSVPDLSISDHCPIFCSRSIKLPKPIHIYHFDLSNI